jgi:lipopolysaccharide export system permease protein
MILTTLDRMLFINYLRSYIIVLSCLLSLYIVLDLFTNLDDFSRGTLVENAQHIWNYYSTRVSQIFDRLSEAITLIAGAFTIVWLLRSNELLPQLAAGIPTQRVLRPILLGSLLTISLGPLNSEFVIPRIAEELTTDRDDPKREKAKEVRGAYDSTGVHLEGWAAFQNERRIVGLFVTLPSQSGAKQLYAAEGVYIPPGDGPETGGWMLYQTTPEKPDFALPPNVTWRTYGKYFVQTREVDFDVVTRPANWYLYASTWKIYDQLNSVEVRRQPAVAVLFHLRIVRPLTGMLLIIIGLSIILQDHNRNVFINVGLCLLLYVLYYALVYGCKFLGENDYVSPALAAWIPVILMAPYSIVVYDAIHS